MANYSLVANSVFQPFSYQELAAPVMEMSAYHEKLADEYDKLSQQADILEAMGRNDRDKGSGTYNRYKAYSDALKREADNLYANGLDTESRHRLTELRRRYNTDIVPIQNAWNKREEEVKMQTTARLQNPHLMFTREAIDSSLEDYINNPTGGFGVINGANITAQMSAMAKNLAAQVRSGRKEGIDEVTYRYIEKHGLTEDLIRNWRNNPTLSKMYEQVMKANGATPELLNSSANAADILDRSTNYAEMGMWDAMGADKSQLRDDPLKLLEAQAAKEIAVAQAKAGGAGNGALGNTMAESLYEMPMGISKDGKRQVATVRGLNYKKGAWNPTTLGYKVREIIDYKDDKPVFDTKEQSLNDLLNMKDSNKNDVSVASFWSEVPGQEGLILTTMVDGKAHRYFISAGSMGERNVRNAKYYFKLAKDCEEAGDKASAAQALEIAYRLLHTGLTIYNESYNQEPVRQPTLKQQGLE